MCNALSRSVLTILSRCKLRLRELELDVRKRKTARFQAFTKTTSGMIMLPRSGAVLCIPLTPLAKTSAPTEAMSANVSFHQ